ncbi:MAG: molybdopterin molybdotransferase MoeA [Chloroflexota bacterium]|nr:molybdopterin molybdotransferase MoeA [Chloroflexota bacterium]
MAQLAPVRLSTRDCEDASRLLDVDLARERVVAAFGPLETVRVPIAEALGLVLAVEVIAGYALPPFANAAMDGFAVCGIDTGGATPENPVSLAVVGEAGAGHPSGASVEVGCAIRIMTGAPIPAGADAVIRFEDTDETRIANGRARAGQRIGIVRAVEPGENVRPAGEEVKLGETVLARGACPRSAEIGLLAALNRTHVSVHRRPRVAILATGDELVDPGQEAGPGQIRNSNTPMVAAMVRQCGGEPRVLGVAGDTTADLRAKLGAARGADLLITTGGVSVGDYDVVKDVLRLEGRIDLWQVRMKPGKPLAFGELSGLPLLGLPGNPIAAAVAFEQFARPAIRAMLGHRELMRPTFRARLVRQVENHGGRRQFVPVRVEADADGFVATPSGSRGAGSLTALTRANGLLVVPETMAVAAAGDMLSVQMLDWEA